MNHTMKNVIRFAGVVAGLAAAAWALRDRMLPDPHPPTENPPKFRTGSAGAIDNDDLTEIKGIGPAYADRLVTAGITTYAILAKSDAAFVAEIAGTTESAASNWVAAAAELT